VNGMLTRLVSVSKSSKKLSQTIFHSINPKLSNSPFFFHYNRKPQ